MSISNKEIKEEILLTIKTHFEDIEKGRINYIMKYQFSKNYLNAITIMNLNENKIPTYGKEGNVLVELYRNPFLTDSYISANKLIYLFSLFSISLKMDIPEVFPFRGFIAIDKVAKNGDFYKSLFTVLTEILTFDEPVQVELTRQAYMVALQNDKVAGILIEE